MKILMLIRNLGRGGAENFTIDLVRQLDPDRFRVLLLLEKGATVRDGVDRCCDVEFLPSDRYLSVENLRFIGELARKARAKLGVSHLFDSDLALFLSLFASRIPLVSHLHSISFVNSSRLHSLRYFLFSWRFSRFIAVSCHVARKFLEFTSTRFDKVSVVRNGIDLARFRHARRGIAKYEPGMPFRIGTLSRLDKRKGIAGLIAAFRLAALRLPGLELSIAGAGEEEAALKRLAHGLSNISFCGCVEPADFYKDIDLAVFPSKDEGLGISAIEAMASGVPIVVSNSTGLTEVTGSSVEEALIDPEDPASFATRLETLVVDWDARKRLAQAQAKRLGLFSISACGARIGRIYADAVLPGSR